MNSRARASEWERKRGRLNHDWLQNQFLMHLDGLAQLLDSSDDDEEFIEELVGSILPKWQGHFSEICELVDSFGDEMSPRTLFHEVPLACCEAESHSWMAELVQVLWRGRYPVETWVAEARQRADEADEAYRRLLACVDTESTESVIGHLRENRQLVIDLRKCCENLSDAIGRFPHRVLVT